MIQNNQLEINQILGLFNWTFLFGVGFAKRLPKHFNFSHFSTFRAAIQFKHQVSMVYLLQTAESDAFDKGAILTPRGFDPWLN